MFIFMIPSLVGFISRVGSVVNFFFFRLTFQSHHRYTSTTTVEQHLQEPHFKAMLKTMEDEGLMASPPAVLKTTTIAGFDLDRELVL
jgi:hypothetical protein